jgi:hypothetical protein
MVPTLIQAVFGISGQQRNAHAGQAETVLVDPMSAKVAQTPVRLESPRYFF